ncbi:CBS domain-containing protein [Qipengyuania gaetbuli]|uniref:CBS domain-containing protein n=1 Tax=Qipengyuania gaetbuli TaxID=266952 RepID=UPI001CFC79F4|nr:CBS domain-containing protein [Qipengyuania gaetbuli]
MTKANDTKSAATRRNSTDQGTGPPTHTELKACNIMSGSVISIHEDVSIHDAAEMLIEHGVSALPVVSGRKILGILSETDLLHREELGNPPDSCDIDSPEPECVKAFGQTVGEVMTPVVVTVEEDTTLSEIANLMDEHRIKHLPVLRENELVGIVSRADIVRALIVRPIGSHGPMTNDDDIIRARVIEKLLTIKGASAWLTDVAVSGGVVTLTGTVQDEDALLPSRTAVAAIPFVKSVDDHRAVTQAFWG